MYALKFWQEPVSQPIFHSSAGNSAVVGSFNLEQEIFKTEKLNSSHVRITYIWNTHLQPIRSEQNFFLLSSDEAKTIFSVKWNSKSCIEIWFLFNSVKFHQAFVYEQYNSEKGKKSFHLIRDFVLFYHLIRFIHINLLKNFNCNLLAISLLTKIGSKVLTSNCAKCSNCCLLDFMNSIEDSRLIVSNSNMFEIGIFLMCFWRQSKYNIFYLSIE